MTTLCLPLCYIYSFQSLLFCLKILFYRTIFQLTGNFIVNFRDVFIPQLFMLMFFIAYWTEQPQVIVHILLICCYILWHGWRRVAYHRGYQQTVVPYEMGGWRWLFPLHWCFTHSSVTALYYVKPSWPVSSYNIPGQLLCEAVVRVAGLHASMATNLQ